MTDKSIEKRVVNAEELEKAVLDTLYSRTLCREIGIDYNNPEKVDWDRARQYLLKKYLTLETQSHIQDESHYKGGKLEG